jgi:hypothetical protein
VRSQGPIATARGCQVKSIGPSPKKRSLPVVTHLQPVKGLQEIDFMPAAGGGRLALTTCRSPARSSLRASKPPGDATR